MPPFVTFCTYLQTAGWDQPALHDTFIAIHSYLLTLCKPGLQILVYCCIIQ